MAGRWVWLVVVGVGVAAVLVGGCAGYSVRDLSTGQEGYVVYEPWPYLLRTEFATGVWKFQVVYLPNRGKPYRVRSWAGLGKADFEFTFENGWMFTGLKNKSDNSAVLESLMTLAKPLVPTEKIDPARPPELGPRLYRLEFDACGMVCGLTPVDSNEAVQRCPPSPR